MFSLFFICTYLNIIYLLILDPVFIKNYDIPNKSFESFDDNKNIKMHEIEIILLCSEFNPMTSADAQ